MTATTAPRQESKKLRRRARNLLRHVEVVTPQVKREVQALREQAVHAEPRHRLTADHALRCNATEPFAHDEL